MLIDDMSLPGDVRPIEILQVEDNAVDVYLTKEALREGNIHNNLHVGGDDLDALAFLYREGKHANAAHPDLVLLDLS